MFQQRQPTPQTISVQQLTPQQQYAIAAQQQQLGKPHILHSWQGHHVLQIYLCTCRNASFQTKAWIQALAIFSLPTFQAFFSSHKHDNCIGFSGPVMNSNWQLCMRLIVIFPMWSYVSLNPSMSSCWEILVWFSIRPFISPTLRNL